MINTLTMDKRPGESKDDFLKRVLIATDKNWEEIKTRKTGESFIAHYERFNSYKMTPEFVCYMVGFRNGEHPSILQARHLEISDLEEFLTNGCFDEELERRSEKRFTESITQHYFRFIANESTIITKRSNESTKVFIDRMKNYISIKNKISKGVEVKIINEFPRLNEEESLEDWRDRIEGILTENHNFICDLRVVADIVTGIREETKAENCKRVDFFKKHLLELEVMIDDKKEVDQIFTKEYSKLKAKSQHEQDQQNQQNQQNEADLKKRIDIAKVKIVILFLFMSLWVSFLMYGLDVALVVGACYIFMFVFFRKSFLLLGTAMVKVLQLINKGIELEKKGRV